MVSFLKMIDLNDIICIHTNIYIYMIFIYGIYIRCFQMVFSNGVKRLGNPSQFLLHLKS